VRRNTVAVPIHKAQGDDSISSAQDSLAVEEPLQIRVNGRDLSITMRTPGHDR
jgi:FdhD protein